MDKQRVPPAQRGVHVRNFYAVAPRSALGRALASLLLLTFAVLVLLFFGVFLAAAAVAAAVGAVVLMLKPSRAMPRSTPRSRPGRIIDGEHTVERIEERDAAQTGRRR